MLRVCLSTFSDCDLKFFVGTLRICTNVKRNATKHAILTSGLPKVVKFVSSEIENLKLVFTLSCSSNPVDKFGIFGKITREAPLLFVEYVVGQYRTRSLSESALDVTKG